MRLLTTVLLAVFAFLIGTVTVGIIGDQAPGPDLWPLVVGVALAVLVVWARTRRRSPREVP